MKIFYILLMALVLVPVVYGASWWVSNFSLCPTEYAAQNCQSNHYLCGFDDVDIYCNLTSAVVPPNVDDVSDSGDMYNNSFNGGYIIDCLDYNAGGSVFCSNGAGDPYWCNKNTTCSGDNRKTNCTKDTWEVSTCGHCITNRYNCYGDNACESTTTSDCGGGTGKNNKYIVATCDITGEVLGSGSCECDAAHYACDGLLNDSDGCEIGTGDSCAVDATYADEQCYGADGNCTCWANSWDCDNNDGDNNNMTAQSGGNGCEIDYGVTCDNSATWENRCVGATGNCTCIATQYDCDDSDGDGNNETGATDGVGNGCEIDIGVSTNHSNSIYQSCGTFICTSGYCDCDGDGTGKNTANGCENQTGASCTEGGVDGSWSCSSCSCIPEPSFFQTGNESSYQTNTTQALLWGRDIGGFGWLINMTNTNHGTWSVNGSGCITWMDGTVTCTNPVAGTGNASWNETHANSLYSPIVNNHIHNQNLNTSDKPIFNGTEINILDVSFYENSLDAGLFIRADGTYETTNTSLFAIDSDGELLFNIKNIYGDGNSLLIGCPQTECYYSADVFVENFDSIGNYSNYVYIPQMQFYDSDGYLFKGGDFNITNSLYVNGTVGNGTHRYTWDELNATPASHVHDQNLNQSNSPTFKRLTITSGVISFGNSSATIGKDAVVNISGGVAIGDSSKCYGSNCLSLGKSATANQDATAIGTSSTTSWGGTSIGVLAETGLFSTAIGYSASCGQAYGICIGNAASVSGSYATALGTNSAAANNYAVSIGYWNQALGENSLVIGDYTQADSKYSLAIGSYARAYENYSMAIGYNSKAMAVNCTAIGVDVTCNESNTVKIGNTSVTIYGTQGNIVASGNTTSTNALITNNLNVTGLIFIGSPGFNRISSSSNNMHLNSRGSSFLFNNDVSRNTTLHLVGSDTTTLKLSATNNYNTSIYGRDITDKWRLNFYPQDNIQGAIINMQSALNVGDNEVTTTTGDIYAQRNINASGNIYSNQTEITSYNATCSLIRKQGSTGGLVLC